MARTQNRFEVSHRRVVAAFSLLQRTVLAGIGKLAYKTPFAWSLIPYTVSGQ